MVFYNNPTDPGLIDGVLLVIVLVAVLVRVRCATEALGIRERFSFAPRVRPVPRVLREHVWWVRHHTPRSARGLALVAAAGAPAAGDVASRVTSCTRGSS